MFVAQYPMTIIPICMDVDLKIRYELEKEGYVCYDIKYGADTRYKITNKGQNFLDNVV